MRRRLLLGIPFALLLAAVAVLGAVPALTDWTARRDLLAALASERIGRRVGLFGPVRLRLLPRPEIEASGVTVGEPDDALAATANALRLRLDGPALLIGRIVPREVALVGAEIRVPWPPVALADLPRGLPALEAELEDSRLVIGGVALEQVRASLRAGDPGQALRATGRFLRDGLEWRFDAGMGRPGNDGATPVELTVSLGGAVVAARGVLQPEGIVEGTVEASGPDLPVLLPGPPGPFRARGRLTVAPDLVAADELALEVGGTAARGAVTLRLSPSPRLDAALAAARVDLDPWYAALRARPGPGALPLGLDLSAEAATLRGVTLRRLRAAAFREGERLTLTDVSAVLPGETTVELNGATAGERLEAAVRVEGTDLRAALAALGVEAPWIAPGRLRAGAGRARLVLEPGSTNIAELAAVIDGTRVSGAGVLRTGQRTQLGLGLTLDSLDLDSWLRPELGWAGVSRGVGAIDANLRVAADSARWGGVSLERASLDAALENGRLTLRRLSGQVARAEVVASGVALLGPAPRLSDATLEVSAPELRALAAMVPGGWPDDVPLAAEPVTLRATAAGALDALAVGLGMDLGDGRVEANGTLDLPARRANGLLTLRHPGAPRVLAAAWDGRAAEWVGDGSLSLVAALAASPQGVAAERFDLVAGALRAQGAGTLALEGVPRLGGRVAIETLVLPAFRAGLGDPLPLGLLRAAEADLALRVDRLEGLGLPPPSGVSARLRLASGRLSLEEVEAVLSEGALRGAASLDATAGAGPPRLAVAGTLRDAVVTGTVTGLPFDLVAGRGSVELRLEAAGSSPATLLSTLSGEATGEVRNGVLFGFDGTAAASAAAVGDEAALRGALAGGATGVEAMAIRVAIAGARATVAEARGAAEGATVSFSGEADVARGALDLAATVRPTAPGYDGPEVGVRVTGPAGRVRRVPEVAGWLRWRAAR
ncbi:AsmA-like C-terminal region-containing protein [Roseomonas sp. CCTCC AB2023176]|uniref:AsmA-like C-terminal region-containing protein n=1 Tax=Roseomonas sp. CCTCC AB2023176 TaxID=3342640 RepID=UPI0035E0FDF3